MFKNISNNWFISSANNRFMLSSVISGIVFGTIIGKLVSYDKYKPYPPLSYKK